MFRTFTNSTKICLSLSEANLFLYNFEKMCNKKEIDGDKEAVVLKIELGSTCTWGLFPKNDMCMFMPRIR